MQKIVVVVAGFLIAGASSLQATNAQAPEVSEQDEALKAELIAEGEKLFQTHCAACHGAELGGGEGPKLASSRNVGQDGVVVQMMVFGGGYMPAFGRLRDREMAAIATFVRNTHGNNYGIVTEDDVDAVR